MRHKSGVQGTRTFRVLVIIYYLAVVSTHTRLKTQNNPAFPQKSWDEITRTRSISEARVTGLRARAQKQLYKFQAGEKRSDFLQGRQAGRAHLRSAPVLSLVAFRRTSGWRIPDPIGKIPSIQEDDTLRHPRTPPRLPPFSITDSSSLRPPQNTRQPRPAMTAASFYLLPSPFPLPPPPPLSDALGFCESNTSKLPNKSMFADL